MKRESIIRGLARWADKEIRPRLPEFSPARIGVATCIQLAATAPAAAESICSTFAGPAVTALLALAATDDFDATAEALVAAVKAEGKMVIGLPGLFGPTPYSLGETDFRRIIDEIRTAEASA